MTGTAVQATPAHDETSNIVKLPPLAFSAEQVKIIKEQVASDLTDSELAYFLEVCKIRRLNPLLRQLYAIKRNVKVKDRNGNERWDSKLTLQTSIDTFRLIAERTGKYAGRGSQLWCGPEGKWVDVWLKDDEPPTASMVGVNKITPAGISMTTAVAKWSEFAQTDRNGKPSGMWAKMASSQLAKCAEAQADRAAFPEELGGIYIDDEMAQADAVPVVAASAPAPAPFNPTPAVARPSASPDVGMYGPDGGPPPEAAPPARSTGRSNDKPACPDCGEPLRRSKPRKGQEDTPPEKLGWYCWKNDEQKKFGCGANFSADDERIVKQLGESTASDPASGQESEGEAARHRQELAALLAKLPSEFQFTAAEKKAWGGKGFEYVKGQIEARQELAAIYAQLPTNYKPDEQELARLLADDHDDAKGLLGMWLEESRQPASEGTVVDPDEAVRAIDEAAQADLLKEEGS